jgi:AcrR family transcriptional regulator
MPLPRFERAAPALRETILSVAAEEFAAQGYDGASLNRILLAAGLSKGAFYYYFDDKADLAATVLENETKHWRAVYEELFEPKTSDDFWREMERLQRRGLDLIREAPHGRDLVSRLSTAFAQHPEILQRLSPMFSDTALRLTAFVKQGQDVGAVRTDLSAEAILGLIQGVKQALGAAVLPPDRAATQEEFERFADLQLNALHRLLSPAAPPTAAMGRRGKSRTGIRRVQ